MRRLRVIWRFIRKLTNRSLKPSPPFHSISLIDPKEFSDLITSGRKRDLQALAKRLSDHHRRPQVKGTAKQTGQNAMSPKGSGLRK
jgi:hypothetical protein